MENLFGILFRASILYIFVLVVVRLSGKRTIYPAAAMDLVVVFAIGDMFDDIVWASVSVVTGFTAITTIAVLHVLNSYAGHRSKKFQHLVGGHPALLIEQGRLKEDEMAKARVSYRDLWPLLRLKEVEDAAEVKEGRLELNGHFSVIKTEKTKDAQKSDKNKLQDIIK